MTGVQTCALPIFFRPTARHAWASTRPVSFVALMETAMVRLETSSSISRTRTRLWGHPSSNMAAPLSGCTAVVGHTPTPILNGPLDDPYVIWHGNGIIGIDCGCEGSDDLRKLACLRLEDLAEFYA